jgi:hypothetical protein
MRLILFLATGLFVNLTVAQGRCVESGDIRKSAEVMPTPDISYAELQYKLVSEISPEKLGLDEGEEFTISCIVNCRGESFDFQVRGLDNQKWVKELKGLYLDVNWSPAIDKNETVDCLASCTFEVVSGQFVMSMKDKGQGKRVRG